MKYEEIVITPTLAKEFLTHNTNNRKLKKQAVTKYAHDMATGLWEESPEPISFYEDGSLRDGQHRLMAIIKANTPIKCLVCFDVPNASKICDHPVIRTDTDIFTMSGDVPALANQIATGTINFLLRYALGGNGSTISTPSKLAFARRYYDTLSKAVQICCAGGSCPQISRKASICASVFCALLYGIDSRVLERFVLVLNTGHESDASEDASIVARNQIIFDYRGLTAGTAAQKEIFAIICQAIADFQLCKQRKKRYSPTADLPMWKRAYTAYIKAFIEEVTNDN